jgi:TonB-linked SusC/RagA family outer membrane protein
MKKLSLLIGLLVISVSTLLAQTKVITGTISSAVEGEGPIPGVTVQVKGTTIGTSTDVNGKYTLTVPENATTIVFSYIGMKKQEVEIAGRSVIDATLQSELVGLNEVVVSAFGIKRNAGEIGTAVSKIETDALNAGKTTSAATALSGKVAGLQINTVNASVNPDVRVLLRGNRSFTGNNQALLVLDGVPANLTYLQQLNPNDIESMNILKGANAAALYGSEAANGVIMVTTKSGSKDRTTIQYSNTTTIDKVAYFPEMQKRFGSGSETDEFGNPLYSYFENQCWGPEFDGSQVQLGLPDENGDKQMVSYSARPDEKYDFWNSGLTVQNDLSFSSGNETGTIYMSLQDVITKGVVPGDEARRDVIRLNGMKKYRGFTATFNFNYTLRTADYTRSDIYWNVINTPMQVPLSSYSNWDADYGVDADGKLITNWADINHYYNAYYYNPYEEAERLRRVTRNDYVTGVIDLNQRITKWLEVKLRTAIAPNFSTREDRTYSRTFSDYGILMSTKGRSVSKANLLSSLPYTGQAMGWRWTNDLLLSSDNKFGDISMKIIAGATMRDSYSKTTYETASGLAIPDLFNTNNRTGELGGESYWSQQRYMGVFGDATFGYKNMAYLHLSGRNDWSSLLDKSQWSFFYPSIDASIILTEMVPSLKSNILSYAKVRGGITKVGSINLDPYSLQNTFSVPSGFPYGSLAATTISDGRNNSSLAPEFTTSTEVGIDLSFLNNRLSTNITAYNTVTTNQTVSMDISRTTGFTSQKINAGEMLNQGIEIEVKATAIATSNLKWDINLNYAYWFNEVKSLSGDSKEILLENGIYAIVGESYPTIKGTEYYKDPDGRVIVDAVTGSPSINPLPKIFGQTVPKHLIGIQTNLTWKGISLAASADYRGGHVFRSGMYADLLFTGIGEFSAVTGRERFVFPNSVINTGTSTAPVYVENTNITTQDGGVTFWTGNQRSVGEYSINSASSWKLREVALSYDLPRSALAWSNNSIAGVRIGLVGRNLLMFLPKNNIYSDPEFNTTTGNAVGYTNSLQTPATRSYGLNITLTF